jgi:hypothetical protein
VHDVKILDEIMPEAGAFYVMDRGYIDFERLFIFALSSAFFVVRTNANVLLQRRYSHKVDKRTAVRSEHTVILTSFQSASVYQDALRRVSYLDEETKKRFKFLTSNFTLPAHHRSNLQVEVGRGVVLQMDQAAPQNQSVLRHQRERREDPDLDRRIDLRAAGHCQKTLGGGCHSVPNSTGFERNPFRENARFAIKHSVGAHALLILISSRSLYSISWRRESSGSNLAKPIMERF